MKLKVKLVLMSGIPTLVITLLTIFLLAGPFELESKEIALILVVALVIAQIVTTIMAVRTSRAITSSIDAVRQVAAGNLNVEMDDVALSRGDEIGVLARSLAGLRDELKYMFQDIG